MNHKIILASALYKSKDEANAIYITSITLRYIITIPY